MNKRKRKVRKGSRVMVGFTLPVVILYSLFFLVPLLMGFYYSLTNWNGISKTYKIVGFSNYVKVIMNPRFLNAIWFNARYMVLLVILVTVVSLVIAMALNRTKLCSTLFRSIYFVPAILSLVTVALIWNELFYRVIPVIGQQLGIEWLSTSLLGNPKTAIYAILAVNLWQGCSIPTVLFIAGLQSVPMELYEAATVDGAGRWARFKNITVPFLIPVINMVIITQVKAGLTVFDYIKAMTDGGPGHATEAIGLLVYKYSMQENKYSQSVAVAMILFVIVGMISLITLRITGDKQVEGD
ncbi:MAG TPA: sugar ABC transporter permease [Clostridiales bacterium]|nr:sugar ABC transporter permease [Clostridiales bacterium]